MPNYFCIHYCFNVVYSLSLATVKQHLDREGVFIAMFYGHFNVLQQFVPI